MIRINLIVMLVVFLISCDSARRSARLTAEAAPTLPPTIASTAAPATIPPTSAPVPTEAADTRYLRIAQDGALPTIRSGAPKGEWKVNILGTEVAITYPMTIGLSNEQTVRQAKLQGAGIVKRLFDADTQLTRVNVIGTLPDGADNAELPAVSLVIERAAYTSWDGAADSLPWQVSPRLD